MNSLKCFYNKPLQPLFEKKKEAGERRKWQVVCLFAVPTLLKILQSILSLFSAEGKLTSAHRTQAVSA